MKQFRREAKTAVSDFLHEVNHKLMGDFVSMSNEEIWRFQKMENCWRIKSHAASKSGGLTRTILAILIEHLYGQTGTAYEDYEYYLPKKRFQEETLVKYYDLIKPTPLSDRGKPAVSENRTGRRDGLCRLLYYQQHCGGTGLPILGNLLLSAAAILLFPLIPL